MNYENLLKQKDISPTGKLIILDLMAFPSICNYNKTSAEIAKSIGVSRQKTLIALDELQELGLIKCKVSYRVRTTTITKLLKTIIE